MEKGDDGVMYYIQSRVEAMAPDNMWETTWRRTRMPGLGAEVKSFLFRMCHKILPSEDRISRILRNVSPNCKSCQLDTLATLEHCFFQCTRTKEGGELLLNYVRKYDPQATQSGLLRLEFKCDQPLEHATVWVVSQTLLFLWKSRLEETTVDRKLTRAALEARTTLLRKSRYSNIASIVQENFINA